MSDLSCGCDSGVRSGGGCGCGNTFGGSSCIWIILLLCCCGGNGFGRSGDFGCGCGNDSCLWIILLLCCCGGFGGNGCC
ncbi:chorion class high-cysteine HCB protein 13 [Claveliimonas bilis]|uniref:chorion class high-cysteine HCB protein 13 n=1 Tax=Claveliimonas bilis TaxID=3028070 RepID=UPI002931856D|nr:chorion class high-cysteine HCB protein 13 [Claveliimonas bilis]BDZ81856.1 hypothetical protein Lac3_30650 [Claveliimonas bilis]